MPNNELKKIDIPQMLEISDVVQEAKEQKSFFFKHNLQCKPGQFVMVWISGLDEKPMAVSYWKKNEFAFTSKAIGKFTNSLDKLKKGDKVGIRGTYGSCFSARQNSVVVGGGVGMASVSTLIDVLKNPIIINGARSKDYLIYLKRYKNKNMIAATDDGSFGRKGFTTDILDEVLSNDKKIKIVYTCGQEMMMAGATCVGIGSGIYYRGIGIFRKVCDEMEQWMKKNKVKSLNEIRGAGHK